MNYGHEEAHKETHNHEGDADINAVASENTWATQVIQINKTPHGKHTKH